MSSEPTPNASQPAYSEPSVPVKRTRSPSNSPPSQNGFIAASDVAPLPDLHGELLLSVFTHRSVRFAGAPPNEEFGDSERLAVLGKRVLGMAVTNALFRQRPMRDSANLEAKIDDTLSESTIDGWVTAYEMRNKVRCSIEARVTLTEPKETRLLFYSYVGAVYLQRGVNTALNWIGLLVDPNFQLIPPEPAIQPMQPIQQSPRPYKQSPNKRAKHNNYKHSQSAQASLAGPSTDSSQPSAPPPPPPPSEAPPPVPAGPQKPNPITPATPNASFLPTFNQLASQKRFNLEWHASSTGPPHAPNWTVVCLVDGFPKGGGTGRSKQLAKEAAARQAYYNLGWAPTT